MNVSYGFDLNAKLIYFKVEAVNNGWIGIGFKNVM